MDQPLAGPRGVPKHRRSQTKTNRIYKQIRDLAYASGPGARLPMIDEMCVEFSASRATLNDALEQLETQKIIYRKRGRGIFVSQKILQRNIALVISSHIFLQTSQSPFWDALWTHFIAAAQERNRTKDETFSMHVVQEMKGRPVPFDDHLAELIESRQIDGVLGVGLQTDTSNWIREREVPIASFAGNGTWHVIMDFEQFVRRATNYLIDQGCRNLQLWLVDSLDQPSPAGYIAGEDDEQIGYRIRMFREILESRGLTYQRESVVSNLNPINRPRTNQDQGYLSMERLIKSCDYEKVDGIVISDDIMTLGATKAMRRLGAERPIPIVSHANKGVLTLYPVDDFVTRLEFDPKEIVTELFTILERGLSEGLEAGASVTVHPSQPIPPSTNP